MRVRTLIAAGMLGGSSGHGHRHHHHQEHHVRRQTESSGESFVKCALADPTEVDFQAQARAIKASQPAFSEDAFSTDVTTVNSAEQEIIVPVCFHVVANTTFPLQLTNDVLQRQLDALNIGYGPSSCCDTALAWCQEKSCSIDTQVRFVLGQLTDKGDDIDGFVANSTSTRACITRTFRDEWSDGETKASEMKQKLRRGDGRTLNVYFVKFQRDVLGYATLPWSYATEPHLDGVVISYDTLPGGSRGAFSEGDTLIHEVGHWMGLLHTFDGGCSIGEGILDTAPEARPNAGCPADNTTPIRDSCGRDDRPDPIFNFMDYSDDACLYQFTQGQKRLMHATWKIYRDGQGSNRDVVPLNLRVEAQPVFLAPYERQVYELDLATILRSNRARRPGPLVTCTTDLVEGEADLFISLDKSPTFSRADCCFSEKRGGIEGCHLMLVEDEGQGEVSNDSDKTGGHEANRFSFLNWLFNLIFGQRQQRDFPICVVRGDETKLYAGVQSLNDLPAMGLTIKCE